MKKSYRELQNNETYLSLEYSNTEVSKTRVRIDKQRYIALLATALNVNLVDGDVKDTASAVSRRLKDAANMVHAMDGKSYIKSSMVIMSQLLELIELLDDVEPSNKPCYVS